MVINLLPFQRFIWTELSKDWFCNKIKLKLKGPEMAKLHELLAVENTLGETVNRIRKETTKTLSTKESIF